MKSPASWKFRNF